MQQIKIILGLGRSSRKGFLSTRRAVSTASAPDLKDAYVEHQLRVSEIFQTVQGEGPFVGRPSVFLRLGFCNLQCIWCDTKFTWLYSKQQVEDVRKRLPAGFSEPEDFAVFNEEQEISVLGWRTVLEKIQSVRSGAQAVVISGGEPLLQKRKLLPLIQELMSSGLDVEFETNGTVSPSKLPEGVHFNVSPKLSNSYNPESWRLRHDVLQEFAQRRSVFKFVIGNPRDLQEVEDILAHVSIPKSRVFLMPEGVTAEAINRTSEWLVEVCKKSGYMYSHRLHLILFGSKRGT
mmetsp:Transcript_20357/g.35005  ORF Transcript_20357/g.35005 Transcript_20357/m.35005 type:complete len:290 (-) Transcript_20357:113-982(-)